VNKVACGRCLCFDSKKRGLCNVQLGMNIMVCCPGWRARDKTPAVATSAAAVTQSRLEQNPHSITIPSWKARKAAMKWSGCGTG